MLILSSAFCVIIHFLYNHIRYLSKSYFNFVIWVLAIIMPKAAHYLIHVNQWF
ncbi:putative membrane protein [Klebsiella michiganensis]|nr:putative membrane protein [Klebsiella michiganensis]